MAWSARSLHQLREQPVRGPQLPDETNCSTRTPASPEDVKVIENMVTGDAMGSLTPIPRLQLGLRVPVTWVKGQGLTDSGTGDPNGLRAAGHGRRHGRGQVPALRQGERTRS